MKDKTSHEFESFDKVMGGLLAVPYSELQEKLEEEKRDKAKGKKKKVRQVRQPNAPNSRRGACA